MAIELKSLTNDELHERLEENLNWLRELRFQRQSVEDQILGVAFHNDDIHDEIASRRQPLRLVAVNG